MSPASRSPRVTLGASLMAIVRWTQWSSSARCHCAFQKVVEDWSDGRSGVNTAHLARAHFILLLTPCLRAVGEMLGSVWISGLRLFVFTT